MARNITPICKPLQVLMIALLVGVFSTCSRSYFNTILGATR
ncbi:MAG: hypothetical protein ACI9WS_002456 [Paraglaciecola psychrophila]|jgi:hypothetical protein